METDKATVDFESQEDGYLAAILVPNGTAEVTVGTLVAVIADSQGDVGAFTGFTASAASAPAAAKPAAAPAPVAAVAPAPQAAAAPAVKYPPHQVLKMPSLSPTMTKGNIGEWKKKIGDKVSPGEVYCTVRIPSTDGLSVSPLASVCLETCVLKICYHHLAFVLFLFLQVETDKATVDFESQEDGYLAAILIPNGTAEVTVGSLLAVIADSQGDVGAFAGYTGTAAPVATATAAPATASAGAAPAAAAAAGRYICRLHATHMRACTLSHTYTHLHTNVPDVVTYKLRVCVCFSMMMCF